MEVPAQDWPNLYKKNFKLFCEASRKAVDLAELQTHKQEMYIFREQEYRKVIEELKSEIDRISQKPLQEQKRQTEDQQHLIGIKV